MGSDAGLGLGKEMEQKALIARYQKPVWQRQQRSGRDTTLGRQDKVWVRVPKRMLDWGPFSRKTATHRRLAIHRRTTERGIATMGDTRSVQLQIGQVMSSAE